ncbi:hypothetical protein ELR57_10015 [Cohnella sp. AR92]|nr:hypothetical protein ELR57_10015 [Cohnella sp. AR92]
MIYLLLKNNTSGLTALLVAMSVPLAEQLYYWMRNKRVDSFGLLMVGAFVLGVGLALVGGDERMVLLRESFVTVSIGCVFLFSLLLEKPLIYSLSLRFVPAANEESLKEKWQIPYFRKMCRLITAMWAAMLISESAIRVWLIYQVDTAAFLLLSNVLFYSFIGAAILCSILMRRRLLRRIQG